ncbi:hypothetical protein VaNZ11_007055 [Volvox africanus]|uniref:Alpha-type protein kinase domain-containing protein n=1 Tax=Volvox africanus TaxID=51714 RepID=A0ABQ5S246_9CHLO|nr:hypothetical protein VaNZ11_007055 [Volvox africanus]
MAPVGLADAPSSLAELEAQLGGLYIQIAQQYGLPAAMQALGRLMLSTSVLSGPIAPVQHPASAALETGPGVQVHLVTSAAAAALPPAAASSPPPTLTPSLRKIESPFGAVMPSRISAGSSDGTAADAGDAAISPTRPTPTRPAPVQAVPQPDGGDDSTADDTSRRTPSRPIAIPPPVIPPQAALLHSRTLESIRTVPSATLSQMPSGILSLVSPSVAGGGSAADNEGPMSSCDLDAANTAAAAGRRSSGGAGVGVGVGDAAASVADAPRAAKTVLAVAVGRDDALGESGEAAGSPRSTGSVTTKSGTPRSCSLWHRAINLTKTVADPWASRNLHALHMERAVRQRYNALTGHWVTDEVLVKMESKPFAAGAMRECYAAKKLSTFTHNVDWHKAQNMVAKRYKKEGVRKAVYYNDVLVQMDAKMLGEMYNKTDPPKQVDVMQCAILQFPGRPDSPVYAVEQLIEGDYVKYNSNSGFVKGDELLRNTPQAFSHFTWVLTKGLKICVDIQGVGDLYTDPQLHTLDGEGYGEGNLGLRGMGLFFRSHECNALCCRMGLKSFDRCDADVRSQGYSSDASSASASATRRGGERPGATAARTLARTTSYKAKMAERKRRAALNTLAANSCAEEVLLAALKEVPKENPEALVHLEIAKLYGEVVLLPELKPNEDPEDALHGGLFHLNTAAQGGSLLGLMILARAHCGIEASSPQFAQLVKVGTRQRQFRAFLSVSWRCVMLAAERGVRGAALAAAAAYGGGGGLFADEVLQGQADPVQAVRWYDAALALPDLLADSREGPAGGTIHEHEEEGEESGTGTGTGSAGESDEDDQPQFEMSVMRESPRSGGEDNGHNHHNHHKHHHHQDRSTHISGLSDLDLVERGGSMADLEALRVPKLDELRPSRTFLARLKWAVEEEAAALPGASAEKYEILFQYGNLLLSGGPGMPPQPARAAEVLEQAAEEAGAVGKGKLAQKYYEVAARAQAMCEDVDVEE